MRLAFPGYETPEHTQRIAEKLTALERGDIRRLMIHLPPRFGKSMLCSQGFTAWWLGRNPSHEVMVVSYSAALAETFSRKAREIVSQHGESVFDLKISQESRSAESWSLQGHSGAFHAVGTGGSLTGRGAHLLVLDDLLSGAAEADSEIEKLKLREWLTSVALTRLSLKPRGRVLLVSTRWREDDPAGHLLEQAKQAGAEPWEVVSLPLVDDRPPYMLADGPILWPERNSREDVERIRRSMSAREFEALYQQRPSPPGGAMLKRADFQTYRTPPASCSRLVLTVDSSFSGAVGADPVALHVWGRSGDFAYLLDRVSRQMDFPATLQVISDLARKWPSATIYIERKGNGQALVDTLQKQVSRVKEIPAPWVQSGKVGRVNSVANYFEAHRVCFPDPIVAPWVREVFDQLARFPHVAHDDDVDATTYALLAIMPGATSYYTGIPSPRQVREMSGDGWHRPDHSGDSNTLTNRRSWPGSAGSGRRL